MIYPITAYGDPILRKKALPVKKGTALQDFVQAMFATMYAANGIGLAAPQIGKSIRLFVVDLTPYREAKTSPKFWKKALINPEIHIDTTIEPSTHEEGCLSIPHISVTIPRQEKITVSYFDTQWTWHQEEFTGFPARVIQHEYDHLEGKLHIDYAPPLKKRLLKSKLHAISQGKVTVPYPMNFPTQPSYGKKTNDHA